MSDLTLHPADGSVTRALVVERFGHEIRRDNLGRTVTEIALEVHHVERRSKRVLDDLARHQEIELPSSRRGVWIYRAATYAVNPWDVLAYVGDATGDEAVRLSEEFLDRVDSAFEAPEHP